MNPATLSEVNEDFFSTQPMNTAIQQIHRELSTSQPQLGMQVRSRARGTRCEINARLARESQSFQTLMILGHSWLTAIVLLIRGIM